MYSRFLSFGCTQSGGTFRTARLMEMILFFRLGDRQALRTAVSVAEVSQTGDRDRCEAFQPLALTAHVGGFVDWARMSQVSWTGVQPIWVLEIADDF